MARMDIPLSHRECDVHSWEKNSEILLTRPSELNNYGGVELLFIIDVIQIRVELLELLELLLFIDRRIN